MKQLFIYMPIMDSLSVLYVDTDQDLVVLYLASVRYIYLSGCAGLAVFVAKFHFFFFFFFFLLHIHVNRLFFSYSLGIMGDS